MLFESEIEINALRAYHHEQITPKEKIECGFPHYSAPADDNGQGIEMRSFSDSTLYEGGSFKDDDK